jgi:hypothetical protein
MGRFEELSTNKYLILSKLIEDLEIVKCLVNNESNFLDISLPEDFEASSLIYNHIFPYKYIPTIETTPKTFITISFNYRSKGMSYKNGSIVFYVITHNSLIKTDYGFLRYDFLIHQIDEFMNSSRDIGLGKLEFYDMADFSVNDYYSGAYIRYRSTEFQ